MDGNNQNFNYFLIKFNDFNQINIGGVTLTYFIEFFNKIYQLATSTQLQYINNRTYKHGFSTKMIGCYLGLFSRLVCMRYHCTLHQTLYAWLMRGVWYWCGLESLIIGSYIYHSDVIAGMHAMLLI